MSEVNVELVRRALEAYNLGDFDAMRAMNHPDIALDWSRSRGFEARVYRGSDEVMRFYRGFLGTFDEAVVVPERCIEAGDSVVVPNSFYLRGRDGIETSARSALVFRVQDGLIAEICLYQTLADAREAAGLSE
jgi:ketosteroid isomerase-like protein